MKLFRLLILFCVFGLLGCGYIVYDNSTPKQKLTYNLPAEKIASLSYPVLAQKVFTPKCISCHASSDEISLATYADIVKNKDLIMKAVFVDKTMPKKGSLSEEELAYLWNWLEIEAPEFPQNGEIDPPILEEPLVATFASIDKNVFQVTCKECHNPTGTGKRVGLDKDSLMNSPLELILPENPDESGLIIALERSDDKRMPPAKEGYSAIDEKSIAVIRKWIANGAKD